MSGWILILLAAGLLQSTLISRVTLLGAHPNLLLAIVVCWTVLRGGREGLIWGLVAGMLLDLYSAAPFGTFIVSMLVVAFLAGLTELMLLGPTVLLPFGLMLLISPLFQIVSLVMLQSLGGDASWARIASLIVPAAIMDALLVIPLFPLLRRASQLAGKQAIEWT